MITSPATCQFSLLGPPYNQGPQTSQRYHLCAKVPYIITSLQFYFNYCSCALNSHTVLRAAISLITLTFGGKVPTLVESMCMVKVVMFQNFKFSLHAEHNAEVFHEDKKYVR